MFVYPLSSYYCDYQAKLAWQRDLAAKPNTKDATICAIASIVYVHLPSQLISSTYCATGEAFLHLFLLLLPMPMPMPMPPPLLLLLFFFYLLSSKLAISMTMLPLTSDQQNVRKQRQHMLFI